MSSRTGGAPIEGFSNGVPEGSCLVRQPLDEPRFEHGDVRAGDLDIEPLSPVLQVHAHPAKATPGGGSGQRSGISSESR